MGKRKLDQEKIKKIVVLRSKGYSLPEISNKLSISRTTVFRYIKDVQILPEFLTKWTGKRGGSRKRKEKHEKKALQEAKKLIAHLTRKEKLLFISALYWAEGSKTDFGLSNTDPALVKVFIIGLKEVFDISNERLRISIRIYEDLDRDSCLSFWSSIVGIPKEKFVNVNILKGKKQGKLTYGMCRVRVTKGGDILKKINAVNKIVHQKLI